MAKFNLAAFSEQIEAKEEEKKVEAAPVKTKPVEKEQKIEKPVEKKEEVSTIEKKEEKKAPASKKTTHKEISSKIQKEGYFQTFRITPSAEEYLKKKAIQQDTSILVIYEIIMNKMLDRVENTDNFVYKGQELSEKTYKNKSIKVLKKTDDRISKLARKNYMKKSEFINAILITAKTEDNL